MASVFGPRFFDFLANEPSSWFGSADTLLKMAAPVWDRRNLVLDGVWVALMLRGYVVENLLKGLLVQQGHRLSVKGRLKGIPGVEEHNLVQLSKKVGLNCSQITTNVQHALSHAITHLGRYKCICTRTNIEPGTTLGGRSVGFEPTASGL